MPCSSMRGASPGYREPCPRACLRHGEHRAAGTGVLLCTRRCSAKACRGLYSRGHHLCNKLAVVCRAWHLALERVRGCRRTHCAVRACCTPYGACAYLVGCPLHRYKDLDSSGQDWDLQPLWTLIGDVDPRRFVIVRRGVGSFAENCSTIAYQPSGMPWSLARVCSHGLSHGLEC